jgi:hypothetical protein
VHGATASSYYEAVLASVLTIGSTQDIILVAQASTATAFCRENAATGEQATVMQLLKVA